MRNTILAALIISLTAGPTTPAAREPADTLGTAARFDRGSTRASAQGREAAPGSIRATAATPSDVGPGASDTRRCVLTTPGSDNVPTSACAACHRNFDFHGHPVSVDYVAAQSGSRGSLRPIAEVVQRGVFLPEGMVGCTTCHDGRSPWAKHIALPPGAVPRSPVEPRRPETYENRPSWRSSAPTPEPRLPPGSPVSAASWSSPTAIREAKLPPGSPVSAAPLCAVCHTLAD